MAKPFIPIEHRFWAKVLKTATCWLWQGQKNRLGYGRLSKPGKDSTEWRAHVPPLAVPHA